MIRIDRILDEVQATSGDIRRLCDLFGLSVSAAAHYIEPLDRTDALDPTAERHASDNARRNTEPRDQP